MYWGKISPTTFNLDLYKVNAQMQLHFHFVVHSRSIKLLSSWSSSMDPSLEVVQELLPILRVYKDGHVERLVGSKLVPPTPFNNSVTSKDITISLLNPEIQARIYLPNYHPSNKLIPLVLYFPGGGFCYESAFSFDYHRCLNHIVSTSNVVAVSVNYRRAPEHPLPCAYEDCWSSLQWVLTHKTTANGSTSGGGGGGPQLLEPWLVNYVDFDRIFMGGDSAGANIAHNIAMRIISAEKLLPKVVIRGVFLVHSYFLGSDLIGSDPFIIDLLKRIWLFVNPTAVNGIDDPRINPIGPGAPSLSGLGCNRVLVFVAGKDPLVERSKAYVDALKKSGWEGEVELFENEEEGHVFHVLDPECVNAQSLFNRLATFLNNN